MLKEMVQSGSRLQKISHQIANFKVCPSAIMACKLHTLRPSPTLSALCHALLLPESTASGHPHRCPLPPLPGTSANSWRPGNAKLLTLQPTASFLKVDIHIFLQCPSIPPFSKVSLPSDMTPACVGPAWL